MKTTQPIEKRKIGEEHDFKLFMTTYTVEKVCDKGCAIHCFSDGRIEAQTTIAQAQAFVNGFMHWADFTRK